MLAFCVFREAEYELQMGPAQTHLRGLATAGGKRNLRAGRSDTATSLVVGKNPQK